MGLGIGWPETRELKRIGIRYQTDRGIEHRYKKVWMQLGIWQDYLYDEKFFFKKFQNLLGCFLIYPTLMKQ